MVRHAACAGPTSTTISFLAREEGNPLPLDHVTERFREPVVAAGLRPVRLHDLRGRSCVRR
ncbi:MAG: hypothetical protein ACRDRY_03710 [Pseudonocardiaceae bacterium]